MMTFKNGPRIWSFSLYILSAFSLSQAVALNLTYVSPDFRAQVESDFNSAHSQIPKKLEGRWNCEFVGMKTGLQHEKDLVLYDFKMKTSTDIENHGDSPNTSFKPSPSKELESQGSKVTETIRFRSENELISKLMRPVNKETLAFAKCLKVADTVASHD